MPQARDCDRLAILDCGGELAALHLSHSFSCGVFPTRLNWTGRTSIGHASIRSNIEAYDDRTHVRVVWHGRRQVGAGHQLGWLVDIIQTVCVGSRLSVRATDEQRTE